MYSKPYDRFVEPPVWLGTRVALPAGDCGCKSIVVPAVGCGLGGVSLTTGAEVIVEEIRAFDGDSLDDVRVIVYSDDEYEAINRVV